MSYAVHFIASFDNIIATLILNKFFLSPDNFFTTKIVTYRSQCIMKTKNGKLKNAIVSIECAESKNE
jgi:hypothetical protein